MNGDVPLDIDLPESVCLAGVKSVGGGARHKNHHVLEDNKSINLVKVAEGGYGSGFEDVSDGGGGSVGLFVYETNHP